MDISQSKILAGIDPAWKVAGNHSAISYGIVKNNELILEDVVTNLLSVNDIIRSLDAQKHLYGVAVDASLIIPNQSGSRQCEKELTKVYGGKRKAGCYPTNLKLHGNSSGLYLEKHLAQRGFKHLNHKGKFMLETYPHASLIELFNLPERLLYKKGNVKAKIKGQIKLVQLLLSLQNSKTLKLVIQKKHLGIFEADYINKLKGKALKHNEDALDSIICLYVAALFSLGKSGTSFPKGSIEERIKLGYVWVPNL